jgi:hypothetical protein
LNEPEGTRRRGWPPNNGKLIKINSEIMFALIKELSGKTTQDKIRVDKEEWDEAKRIKKNYSLDDRGILYFQRTKDQKPRRVIIGNQEMKRILKEFHDKPRGGYLGIDNTIEWIKKNLYWPKMNDDIEDYVRTCTICQKRKIRRDQV